MSARVQEVRARWENERKQTQRLAVALGVVAVAVIVGYALVLRLSLRDVLLSAALGGAGWGVLWAAFAALMERARRSDLPALLRGPYALPPVLGLFVLLGFYGLLRVPGIAAPLVLGAVTWLVVWELGRLRDLAQPRSFVAVRDDDRTLPVPQGANLLEALEGAGYRLLTRCGRKGQCATCRVRVHEGARKWSTKEQGAALTPRQKGEGWVLSCQVSVDRDMEIELFKPLVIRWPSLQPGELSEAARALRRALPGFHCEVCGYRLCEEYAQAIVERKAPLDRCLPGGEPVRRRLEEIARQRGISVWEPTGQGERETEG